MTTKLKWLRLVTLVMLLGLFAAACGGDPAVESTDAATDEAAAAPTDEVPTDAPTEATDAPTEATEATDAPTEPAATEATEPTDAPTATEGATETEPADPPGTGNGGCGAEDGTLTIGGLLPETGNLAFLGPPEIAGAELAVQDINEGGGVNGADVTYLPGDSGDTAEVAGATVDGHLAACADMILGAASSGVSFTVIDTIIGAGVVQFSPANTSKDFTTYEDGGFYFRTAPSDILQGQALGNQVVSDGFANVALMALQDPYGEGLLADTSAAIEAAGGTVAGTTVYDPQAQTFDAEVQEMLGFGADAYVIIGFNESARIIQGFLEAGVTPDLLYGADGNMSNTLDEDVDPGNPAVLEGMRGTFPSADPESEDFVAFNDRLIEFAPDLEDFVYGAETYDAVTVTALAAVAGGSDAGPTLSENINDVTREGTVCQTFADCAELLAAGEDIDYDGASGPLDFTDAGEPGIGTYNILAFNAEGELDVLDNVSVSAEGA